MSSANIAIARRFMEELWNQRKFEVADEIFSEDFITDAISYQPVPWPGKGPESMKHHIEEWLMSVPDMMFHAQNYIADENHVVIHWIATGTNQHPFMGIPATGEKFELLGMTISHIKDGKICYNQTLLDTLGFLQQLKALPDSGTILSQVQANKVVGY